jgi:hypothetical protein
MPLILTYKCLKCGELCQSTDGNVPVHCNTVCVRDTPPITLSTVGQAIGGIAAVLSGMALAIVRIEKKLDALEKKGKHK